MTIFFAPARTSEHSALARALSPTMPLQSANDNAARPAAGAEAEANTNDSLFRAALIHFAEHGLSAPRRASEFAREAAVMGNEGEAEYWLAICRTLDRRLAAATARRIGTERRA